MLRAPDIFAVHPRRHPTRAQPQPEPIPGPMLKRLRRIEERAVTLTERLAGVYPPAAEGTDELGQTRYRLWCERVARGDAARLEQRLRWDGYDPAQVVRALGALRIDAGRPLPDWLELLREVLAEAAATEGSIGPCPHPGRARPLRGGAAALHAGRPPAAGRQVRRSGVPARAFGVD